MLKDDLKNLIDNWEKDKDFSGGVGDKEIQEAELKLNVPFPESYKWFLKNYGHGNIGGTTIEGIYNSTYFPVVEATIEMRNHGLEQCYVVINDRGEFCYCLDTSNLVDNECPVVVWSMDGIKRDYQWDNMYSFLLEEFQREINCILEDEDL